MKRAVYIWQHDDWTAYRWDSARIEGLLSRVRFLEGNIAGMMNSVGFDVQSATSLEVMTDDVVRSGEIEGVSLSVASVRSSIARHLGIDNAGLTTADHYTDGVVLVMLDAVRRCNEPLTHERLYGWHASLFPMGHSGPYRITVGAYRTGEEAMQVVSGAMGKERVHYEAPPSCDVPALMDEFVAWVNAPTHVDPLIKAAIAHLWFVAIHPFDDGNGRLARTITDMLLSRADGHPWRFYSMSAQIMRQRKSYYEVLEKTTTGTPDITTWIEWFLMTLQEAIERAQKVVERVLEKSLYWQRHRGVAMNERQTRMVNLLWDGFEGKLTTSKWAKITKVSQTTALRDITDLVRKGALSESTEGGRSTHYILPCDSDR